MTQKIPEGYRTVTPMLMFKDTHTAIEFYKRAFGAQEHYAMPGPDGKGVMHAEVQIGNSIIMMGDEHPQQPCKSAETIGSSPVSFYLYVENVDEGHRGGRQGGHGGSGDVLGGPDGQCKGPLRLQLVPGNTHQGPFAGGDPAGGRGGFCADGEGITAARGGNGGVRYLRLFGSTRKRNRNAGREMREKSAVAPTP